MPTIDPISKRKFYDLSKQPCEKSQKLNLQHWGAVKKAMKESLTQTKH